MGRIQLSTHSTSDNNISTSEANDISNHAESNHAPNAPVDNIVVPSLGGSDDSFFPGDGDYTDSNFNDDKTHAEVQSDKEYEEYDMPILESPLAEYDYESLIELESNVAMVTVCDTVANEKEKFGNGQFAGRRRSG